MPIYDIQTPNGKIYSLQTPESVDHNTAIQELFRLHPEAFEPAKPSSYLGSLAKGAESFGSQVRTGVGSLFGNPEEAAAAGIQRGEGIQARRPDEVGFGKVQQAYESQGLFGGAKEVVRQVPHAIAEQVPQLGAMAASGFTGAKIGALAGPVGATVGGLLGAALPSFAAQLGGNVERQAHEQQKLGKPVDIGMGAATAAATGQAALDVAAQYFTFGARAIGALLGVSERAVARMPVAEAERLAKESLLKSAGMGTVRGVVGEVPPEVGQTMLERLQAGLPLTTPDAIAEYGETIYQTTLLGPVGIVGRRSDVGAARQQLAPEPVNVVPPYDTTVPTEGTPDFDARMVPDTITQEAPVEAVQETPVEVAQEAPVEAAQEAPVEAAQEVPVEVRETKKQRRERERRENAEATARILADIKEQKLASESAFAQASPDLFGEYRPEATPPTEPPIAEERPAFTLGQQAQQLELPLEPPPAPQQLVVDDTLIKELGVKGYGSTKVKDGIRGLDLMTREGRNAFYSQFHNAPNGTSYNSEVVTRLLQSLPPLEQGSFDFAPQGEPNVPPTSTGDVTGASATSTGVSVQQPAPGGRGTGVSGGRGVAGTSGATGEPLHGKNAEPGALTEGEQPKRRIKKPAAKAAKPKEAPVTKLTDNALKDALAELETTRDPKRYRALVEYVVGDYKDGATRLRKIGIPETDIAEADARVKKQKEHTQNAIATAARVAGRARVAAEEAESDRQKEAKEEAARLSQGAGGGSKPADVRSALREYFPDDASFDRLTTIVQSESELPQSVRDAEGYTPGVRGVAHGKRVYLVADNIAPGQELGVFLHEAGAHFGFDAVMTGADRAALAEQVRKWAEGTGVRADAAKAALAKGGSNNDEIIAYTVEELVNRGVTPVSFRPESTWLRKVLDAFKKVLAKLGFAQDINPQELVDLAYGAAHIPMEVEPVESGTRFRRFDRAGWTQERFDRVFDDFAHPDGLVRGSIAYVEPQDFLDAVASIGYQKVLEQENKEYGNPKLSQQGPISLIYNDEGRIVDHEGRHRMIMLRDQGVEKVAVLVKRYTATDDPVPTMLLPQKSENNNGWRGLSIAPMPITYANKKALQEKFVDRDTITTRFSVSNPAMAAAAATAQRYFSGPPAAAGLIQNAVKSVTQNGLKKSFDKFRQLAANQNTYWEELITSIYGNNALDAMGKASALDRVQAATKVSAISLRMLELGGVRKNQRGMWEAYQADGSYKDIVRKVESMVGKYKETPTFKDAEGMFNLAAIARREDELYRANQIGPGKIKPTLSAKDRQEGLALYNRTPEIREALQIFERLNNRNVDMMVAAGLIDTAQAAELKGTTGYVPWYRFSVDANGALTIPSPKNFSRGLVLLSNQKDLQGGDIKDVQINNILDNMAKLSNWMVNKSIGNDTAIYMTNFAAHFGKAKRVGNITDRSKTIEVLHNGVPIYFEFEDAAALPAFKGYETAHSALVRALAAPANLLRKGITRFPVFSLAQLPQDIIRAFVSSELKNPYAIPGRVLKNFAKSVIFKPTGTAETLAQYGIVGKASDIVPGDYTRSFRRRMGRYDKGLGGWWNRSMDALEKWGAASDEALRTALYELTMEETNNPVLALRRAREIINFDTQGSHHMATFLRQTVPFMGVWMNDLNNLYKGLVLGSARLSEGEKQKTRNSIIFLGMQLAALIALYTLAVGDDEDYKKLDDNKRNRSIIVPGSNFRIPVPNDGIGFLFKVIPEQITRYLLAEGIESKDAGAKFGRALFNAFTDLASLENLIPVVGSPLPKTTVELMLNRSFFTQNPIIGKGQELKLPSQQYVEGTSEIAKRVGAELNLSPIKIDYIINGLSGQMGGFVMSMANALFHAADGKFTPSLRYEDIPGAKSFSYNSKDRGSAEDFYELREQVDIVARTYRDLAKFNGPALKEFLNNPDNVRLLELRNWQVKVDGVLEKLRAQRRHVIENTGGWITSQEQMDAEIKKVDDAAAQLWKSIQLPTARAHAGLTPTIPVNLRKLLQ